MSQRTCSAAHILTFAQSLDGGGVERAMLRMAAGWVDAGRRVTLVIGDASGALAHEVPAGLELMALGDRRYLNLTRRLPAFVRGAAPDVVFCPGNHYTGVAFWLRRRLGRSAPPIVAKVSNTLVRRDLSYGAGFAYRRWLRHHPRFIDALVAMTPGMAREAIATMGFDPAYIEVIPNPPALPISNAAPPALPAGRFILGVGRLAPQKRWDRLIEALPLLADATIKLLILGEGGERTGIERLIERLGLSDRVTLPGHAADPLPAIEQAALVALTSDFEGVPGILREAIALGTPVVATDSSVAIHELVDSPTIGTVVPLDDRKGLVTALNAWLQSGRHRPTPRTATGPDPIAAYLALFDRLAQRTP